MGLADLVQRHLARYELTQSEFAREAGLSTTRVNEMVSKRGYQPLREGTIKKLARAMRVPTSVIVTAALAGAGSSEETAESQRLTIAVAHLRDLDPADQRTAVDFIEMLHQRQLRSERG